MKIMKTKKYYLAAAFFAASLISTVGDVPSVSSAHELSDANIAAIVAVAGGLDIEYGRIAAEKSRNKMVREFADRMVTDHSAVQEAVDKLAAKLGLSAEENDMSRGLAANGVEIKAKLKSLKGKDFDKYYINNEVTYHELVVNVTRDVLIPNAKNPELKAALVQTLPLFVRHLEHARMVQKKVSKEKMDDSKSMGH
jgi:putative membrane protein